MQILPVEIRRLEQFETDLEYFKGRDWKKTYKIRDSVQCYLDHLNAINEKNPLLLVSSLLSFGERHGIKVSCYRNMMSLIYSYMFA